MKYEQKLIKLGGICGIVGFIIYFGIIIFIEQLCWQRLPIKTTQDFLTMVGNPPYYQIGIAEHLLMGIGALFFIMAFLGLKHLLALEKPRISVTLGTLFGIIAGAIMVEQMIVQGTVMAKLGTMFIATREEAQRQIVLTLYRGLRYIDYGLDIAFDTFFFSAWILLAYAMLRHRSFGKAFGTIGIALFGVTTIFNIWTAPNPPNFDTGPIVSLWVLAVFIQMLRSAKSLPGTLPTEGYIV